MFINAEPNHGKHYRILITRADDKPKPDNQEEPKVAKPSIDRKSIPCDQMTTHISDRVIPYLKSIASKGTEGKC